jgi:hypothetical protein
MFLVFLLSWEIATGKSCEKSKVKIWPKACCHYWRGAFGRFGEAPGNKVRSLWFSHIFLKLRYGVIKPILSFYYYRASHILLCCCASNLGSRDIWRGLGQQDMKIRFWKLSNAKVSPCVAIKKVIPTGWGLMGD